MESVSDKRTFKNWIYEAFSERGVGSAKRLIGAFITIVSMGCVVYLTITAGPVMIVENLLQTSIITGAALLGLHSITSIWKNGSMSVGGGGKDITYKGEDSKKVLEDVLAKEPDIDEIMNGDNNPQDNFEGNNDNPRKKHTRKSV